jgi:hypothetical protein
MYGSEVDLHKLKLSIDVQNLDHRVIITFLDPVDVISVTWDVIHRASFHRGSEAGVQYICKTL